MVDIQRDKVLPDYKNIYIGKIYLGSIYKGEFYPRKTRYNVEELEIITKALKTIKS